MIKLVTCADDLSAPAGLPQRRVTPYQHRVDPASDQLRSDQLGRVTTRPIDGDLMPVSVRIVRDT